MTYMTMDNRLYIVYFLVVVSLVLGILATYRTYKSVDTSKDHVKSYEFVQTVSTPTLDGLTTAVTFGNPIIQDGIGPLLNNLPLGTKVLAASIECTVGNTGGTAVAGKVSLVTGDPGGVNNTVLTNGIALTSTCRDDIATTDITTVFDLAADQAVLALTHVPNQTLYITGEGGVRFKNKTKLVTRVTFAAPSELP